MRWCAPAVPDPVEARYSLRPFTRRRRLPVLRPVSAAASAFPACNFATIQKSNRSPFGPALQPPPGLLLPCGAPSIRQTRCPARSQDSQLVFELSLPSGIFKSIGIIALSPIPDSEACLCRSPDLPSLPAARQQFLIASRCGSMFRIRYFPPGSLSLRTSWNHSHHAPARLRRQSKNESFLSYYRQCNQLLTPPWPWMICE